LGGAAGPQRSAISYHPRMPAEVRPATPAIPAISLRMITADDLPTLFRQQLDPQSNAMAGTKPYAEVVYHERWKKILADAAVVPMAIVEAGAKSKDAEGAEGVAAVIVGSISCFQRDGHDMVGYWIDRQHWGRGIASRALAMFLQQVPRRPMHAHVLSDNASSIRVLTKCGFRQTGTFAGEEDARFTAGEVTAFVLD
jgi:RimJ/RimL family protein N-acetyltransferase